MEDFETLCREAETFPVSKNLLIPQAEIESYPYLIQCLKDIVALKREYQMNGNPGYALKAFLAVEAIKCEPKIEPKERRQVYLEMPEWVLTWLENGFTDYVNEKDNKKRNLEHFLGLRIRGKRGQTLTLESLELIERKKDIHFDVSALRYLGANLEEAQTILSGHADIYGVAYSERTIVNYYNSISSRWPRTFFDWCLGTKDRKRAFLSQFRTDQSSHEAEEIIKRLIG